MSSVPRWPCCWCSTSVPSLGLLVAGQVADKIGNRRSPIGWFAVAALFLALLSVKLPGIGVYISVLLAGMFVFSAQVLVYAYVAHVYPAAARGTALGAAAGIGRLGAITGPLITGVLLTAGCGLPVGLLPVRGGRRDRRGGDLAGEPQPGSRRGRCRSPRTRPMTSPDTPTEPCSPLLTRIHYPLPRPLICSEEIPMTNPEIITTQVGIVGGGPAGLMLSHLLSKSGIDNVVVEKRDHETIRTTHRAGILEHGSVYMLVDSGVSDRVLKAGYKHEGIDLRFGGVSHRIDFTDLVGESVWLYPQNEVFVDLAAARERDGGQVYFSVSDTEVLGADHRHPEDPVHRRGRRRQGDPLPRSWSARTVRSGICKWSIPQEQRVDNFVEYPFAWFGILCEAPPSARGIDLLQFRARVRADQPAGRRTSSGCTSSARPTRTSTAGPRR